MHHMTNQNYNFVSEYSLQFELMDFVELSMCLNISKSIGLGYS
jgi:hypothetical protein